LINKLFISPPTIDHHSWTPLWHCLHNREKLLEVGVSGGVPPTD
jgi:hypothetical protein